MRGVDHSVSEARSIACIGLSVDTENALHSIVNVLSGRTRCRWQFESPERAVVLVVGAVAGEAIRDAANAPSRRVVAVTDHDGPRPNARFHLSHPFRVMPVLTLLDELDEDLGNPAGADARAAATVPGADQRWSLRDWPDFGVIGGTRAHLRAAALLARGPRGLAELATHARLDHGVLAAWLATLEAQGLVEAAPAPPSARATVAAPPRAGLFETLFGQLRAHLRWERAR